MSKTVKNLFRVGVIVSLFLIFVSVAALTTSIIGLMLKDKIAELALERGITLLDNPKEVEFYSVIILISSILLFIYKIAVILIALRQKQRLENGKKDTYPYIILIVIGVLGNLFFFLCGIFGSIEQEKLPDSEVNDYEWNIKNNV